MHRPLVSVIIPTWNCPQYLPEAIDSALAQTYRPIEIIVIDDGSTDGQTPGICERYAAEHPDLFRYVRQDNAGTAAARNTGIRHSRGDLIALLDHDDRWLPHKLEKQVPLFDDPAVGLVHGGGRVIDLQTGACTSEYLPAERLTLPDIVCWCRIGCATVVMRKTALDAAGEFASDLPGVDDWDMWIRIAGSGFTLAGLREIVVEIREHPNNLGKKFDRLYPRLLAVIDRAAQWESRDPAVAAARRDARRRARQDYYVKACRQSREEAAGAHRVASLAWRLRAIARYPEALGHVLTHLAPGRQPAPAANA